MMYKVIYCISSIDLAAGGPSRSMPTLCIGMKDIGVDCEIRTFASPNPNDSMLRKNCIPIYYLERPKSLKERLFKNPLAIGEENSDIVCHIQNIWDPSLHWVAKNCRDKDIPYVISPRGMLEPWSLSQKKIKKKFALAMYQRVDLEKASCIHTTAESERTSVRKLGIKSPVAVIPNGIDVADYEEKKYITNDKRKRRVLFYQEFTPKKELIFC